jgi:ankyrin repeat protein
MKTHSFIAIIAAMAMSTSVFARTSDLIAAVASGDFAAVEKRLQTETDLNIFTENGFTPLIIACRNGDDKMAALLLAYGADINLNSKDSSSPLIEAARQGYSELAELLLINGADASYRDTNGMSAADYAAEMIQSSLDRDPRFEQVHKRLQEAASSLAKTK